MTEVSSEGHNRAGVPKCVNEILEVHDELIKNLSLIVETRVSFLGDRKFVVVCCTYSVLEYIVVRCQCIVSLCFWFHEECEVDR